jgi:hypothetical protein
MHRSGHVLSGYARRVDLFNSWNWWGCPMNLGPQMTMRMLVELVFGAVTDLLVVFGRAGLNLAQTQPSHGGNRGSNPLGDANYIKVLQTVYRLCQISYGNATAYSDAADGLKPLPPARRTAATWSLTFAATLNASFSLVLPPDT